MTGRRSHGRLSALNGVVHQGNDAMVEAYLKVSRAVFERSGHLAHYGMMMGSARAEEPATSVLHEPS